MNNEELKKKVDEVLLQTAFSKQIKIHLVLTNGTWRNGFVTKILPNVFHFQDKENPEEVFFFVQIHSIEPYLDRSLK